MHPDETIPLISLWDCTEHPFTNLMLYCPICGALYKVSLSHLLRASGKNRQFFHNRAHRRLVSQKLEIDPEELYQLIRDIPIAEVATLYGVSKRDIEKRCRAFGISRDVKDYQFQSESDQRLIPEDPA